MPHSEASRITSQPMLVSFTERYLPGVLMMMMMMMVVLVPMADNSSAIHFN